MLPSIWFLFILWGALFDSTEPQCRLREKEPEPECPEPPYECPNVNITFHLYTDSSQKKPTLVTEDIIAQAKFPDDLPLKVLLHDYGGNHEDDFNKKIREAYFTRGKYALLALDWAGLGTEACGSEKAAKNVPLVSVCTSRMLQTLRDERGVAPERVHVLGMGMGAHVGALAAGCLQSAQGGGLGRLTALDPVAMPAEVPTALDKGAAILVDVLHTSPGDAGMAQPAGNLDFYVNCGQIPQPRCAADPDPSACSHALAVDYFAESITGKKQLWGDSCTENCRRSLSLGAKKPTDSPGPLLMGEDTPLTSQGIFCVETGEKPPPPPHPPPGKGRSKCARQQSPCEEADSNPPPQPPPRRRQQTGSSSSMVDICGIIAMGALVYLAARRMGL